MAPQQESEFLYLVLQGSVDNCWHHNHWALVQRGIHSLVLINKSYIVGQLIHWFVSIGGDTVWRFYPTIVGYVHGWPEERNHRHVQAYQYEWLSGCRVAFADLGYA